MATFLMALGALACGPEDPGTSGGGADFLDVSGGPGFVEGLPHFALYAELRVDGFLPDLGPIRWFGASSEGTVAVAQLRSFLVRVLDSTGTDLGAVGGVGRETRLGPGGLPPQGGAGWIHDTLWVSDVTVGRIALFSKEGEILRTLPPLVAVRPKEGEEGAYPAYLSVSPMAVYHGDTLLVLAESAVQGAREGPLSQGRHLFRVTSDGRIQDHVLQVSSEPDSESVPFDRRPSSAEAPPPSTVPYHVVLGGDRIAFLTTDTGEADGETWRLTVVDAYGGEVLDRRFRLGGVPAPDGVVAGADRRIWVRLGETFGEASWLVLDPQGHPTGRVSLPPGAALLAASDGRLWVSETDLMGIPALVRYRIREGG